MEASFKSPLEVAPDIYKLLAEDDRVRVIDVLFTIPPKPSMHNFYMFGDTTMIAITNYVKNSKAYADTHRD